MYQIIADRYDVTVDKNSRITISKKVFDLIPDGIFVNIFDFKKKETVRYYLQCMFHGDRYVWNKPLKGRRIKVPYSPGDRLKFDVVYHKDDWHSEYYLNFHKEGPYKN